MRCFGMHLTLCWKRPHKDAALGQQNSSAFSALGFDVAGSVGRSLALSFFKNWIVIRTFCSRLQSLMSNSFPEMALHPAEHVDTHLQKQAQHAKGTEISGISPSWSR